MVEVIIGGDLKRHFTGLLGRIGIDPLDDTLIIGKLDSNDNKTQIQLQWRSSTELSLLRDSIDIVLKRLEEKK